MTKPIYARPSIDIARERLGRTFDAVSVVSGLNISLLAKITTGDKAFANRYKRNNITFETYDTVLGRLSGLWPKASPWPVDLERAEPVDLSIKGLALLSESIASAKAAATASAKKSGKATLKEVQPGATQGAING